MSTDYVSMARAALDFAETHGYTGVTVRVDALRQLLSERDALAAQPAPDPANRPSGTPIGTYTELWVGARVRVWTPVGRYQPGTKGTVGRIVKEESVQVNLEGGLDTVWVRPEHLEVVA